MDTPNPGHDFQIVRSHERPVLDPVTGRPGYSSGTYLNGGKNFAVVLYDGRHGRSFLVVDHYEMKGSPSYLNLYCPICAADPASQRGSLRIGEDNKAMSFELDRHPKFPGFNEHEIIAGLGVPNLGGLLSVEPFGCTWESEPTLRRGFGLGICNWRVSITNNIARDAR